MPIGFAGVLGYEGKEGINNYANFDLSNLSVELPLNEKGKVV